MDHNGLMQYTAVCLVILVLSVTFSAFGEVKGQRKKVFLFLSLGILAFLTMFRSINVGNDTSAYTSIFLGIAELPNVWEYIKSTSIEAGYVVFNWLLSRVSRNPQIIFIVSGAFIYFSVGRFLYKWVKAPGMAVFLIVTMMHFDFLLSAMRQALSFAILLFALDALVEKKPFRYIVLVIIAVTFHNSALLFLFLYPLIATKLDGHKSMSSMYLRIAAGTILCSLMFHRVLALLLSVFPKYSYYLGSALLDGEPRLAIYLKICVYALMMIASHLMSKKNVFLSPVNQRKKTLTDCFCAINAAIIIIAANGTALARLSASLFLFPILQYTNALLAFGKGNPRDETIIALITIVLFYIYGLVIVLLKSPEWYSTYPYSFCF